MRAETNAAALIREIAAHGYRDTPGSVRAREPSLRRTPPSRQLDSVLSIGWRASSRRSIEP